ncbi:MAG: serine protease [Ferruginibacter sp.]
MEDTLLIDAVERFVNGEMSVEEKIYFEDLRKKNPELDQAVVEHIFFINQFQKHNNTRSYITIIHDVKAQLSQDGLIVSKNHKAPAKIIQLWKKSKRTIAVAASIAGIVSIFIASIVSVSTRKETNIKPLVEKLNQVENKNLQIEKKVNKLEAENANSAPAIVLKGEAKFRATGFMIDPANKLIVTNAHVANEARNGLIIENNKGVQFIAKAVFVDVEKDLAIIQVTDEHFKKMSPLPYSIKRNPANLGEHVFMLGYPKQEVVYGEGYISAKNGYQMDTIYCQLSTAANEGSSGSPVVNSGGEVVGIVTSTETNAQGVVYAIKSANIYKALEEVKKMPDYTNSRINSNNSMKGIDRVNQIKKLEEYVFMIKGN